jgi:hypothetical protein
LTNSNGDDVTPLATVTIKIAVPAGFDISTLRAYDMSGSTPVEITAGGTIETIAGVTYFVFDTGNIVNGAYALVAAEKAAPYYPPQPKPPEPEPENKGLFIEDHIAYIVGYPGGNVYPTRDVTRAEVATVFFRLLKDESRDVNKTQTNPYPDVSYGSWYNTAVSVIHKIGAMSGYPDGTFRPDSAITRAEVATLIARFARLMGKEAEDSLVFSDIAGHWANSDIRYAAALGWVNGYPDGTFKPNQNITRAEFITLVNRILERVPETTSDLLGSEMIRFADNADPNAWYYIAVQEATNSHIAESKTNRLVPGQSFEFERWVEMRENRDWVQFEKTWASVT